MQVSQKEKDWAMAESRRKFIMDYASDIEGSRRLGYAAAQKELAEAQARIAELEAEIALLRSQR